MNRQDRHLAFQYYSRNTVHPVYHTPTYCILLEAYQLTSAARRVQKVSDACEGSRERASYLEWLLI